jgi:hypothetical protein
MYPNPSYLETLSRETVRARLEESERKRVIREAILANPDANRNVWLILRELWSKVMGRDQESYIPLSPVPGKSPSI